MTCHDVRAQLSALLDEALNQPERSALEAHLVTCVDCRRELEELRGTVALLGRLGPVHAPAGFVDRVVTEAYRQSWTRRLLDALFRPFRVKLPLEAAAVLLVGISALYVYERTPEVRQLTRPAVPAPGSAVVPPPAAGKTGEAPAAPSEPLRAKVAPAEQDAAREGTPPAATPPAAPGSHEGAAPGASAGLTPAPMTDPRSEAPAAKPEGRPDAKDVKKEARVEPRRDADGAPPASAKTDKLAQSAEPAPSRDAATARPNATPEPPPAAPAPAARAHRQAGGPSAAPPAAPPHENAAGAVTAAEKSKAAAARLMRAADASGRLVVPATEPAEIALDALLSRLGATRVARRADSTPGPILIDVNVPTARYHELLEGLGRIGRWTTDYESKTLPLEIRLEVAITVEP